jgi:hypothetical protein
MTESSAALILLSASIFFALIIERLLEIIKSVYDFIEAKYDWTDFWNQRALSIRERLQNRLESARDPKEKSFVGDLASRYLNKAFPGYEGVPVISANKLRSLTVKTVVKSVGIITGIVIALFVGINVFELVAVVTQSDPDVAIPLGVFDVKLPGWLGCVITGIIMGLGSGPMHKFIVALERARKKRQSTDTA